MLGMNAWSSWHDWLMDIKWILTAEEKKKNAATADEYTEAADLNNDGRTTRSESRAYKRGRDDANSVKTPGGLWYMHALFSYGVSFLFCNSGAIALAVTNLGKGLNIGDHA